MLLPTDSSELAQRRQRSYIQHVLRLAGHQPTEFAVNSVTRFVESYEKQLRAFDLSRVPGADQQPLLQDILRDMPAQVGDALAAALSKYVTTTFKRTTKIISRAANVQHSTH
jgi:hypothetical protein